MHFFIYYPFGYTDDCASLRLTEPSSKKVLCPNITVQYTCILNPIVYNASVSIIWAGSAFNCSASNNTITLTQSASGSLNTSIVMCGNVSAVMTKINGSCYWSVLTISDPIYFNGSTIKCYDGNNAGFIWSDELKQQFKGRCITLHNVCIKISIQALCNNTITYIFSANILA